MVNTTVSSIVAIFEAPNPDKLNTSSNSNNNSFQIPRVNVLELASRFGDVVGHQNPQQLNQQQLLQPQQPPQQQQQPQQQFLQQQPPLIPQQPQPTKTTNYDVGVYDNSTNVYSFQTLGTENKITLTQEQLNSKLVEFSKNPQIEKGKSYTLFFDKTNNAILFPSSDKTHEKADVTTFLFRDKNTQKIIPVEVELDIQKKQPISSLQSNTSSTETSTISTTQNTSPAQQPTIANSQTNKYEFTTLGPNPRAFSFDRLEFLRLLRANQLAFSRKGEYYFGLQALNDRTSSQVNLQILPFLHANTDNSSTNETIINITTSSSGRESINVKNLQGLIDAEEMKIREEQVRKNMLREVRYGGRFAPRVYSGNQAGAINYPTLPFNPYSTFGPYLQPPTPPFTFQNQYMTPTKIPTIRVVDHQNHNNAYAMNDSNRPLSLRYLIQQQPYHR